MRVPVAKLISYQLQIIKVLFKLAKLVKQRNHSSLSDELNWYFAAAYQGY
tara:strand:+ start:342 stop:491 length:150 start_codon:yes stop_codon:yes gene_type:complete